MNITISRHTPIVDRAHGDLVIAWRVRIKVARDAEEAFDDLTFEVGLPKPATAWRREEVDSFVRQVLSDAGQGNTKAQKQYANLIAILESRVRFQPLDGFTFEETD